MIENVRRIHLLGVAGTGMGSFAALLKTRGYEVTGSDENVYPPMSEMLERSGIRVLTPYRPENLDEARPDLVIVGNVIRKINPEATAMRERGLAHVSFPQALGELFLETRHSVVIAGTHGKTTTTALNAHLLAEAGRDPSLLVGGVTLNFDGSFRLSNGPEFVVEGDEYDTAYFDKGPKFLHYRPRSVIFTSCELDHADIYTDEAHYESAFERLMELVPANGFVAACASTETPVRIARARCLGRVETYSAKDGIAADWTIQNFETDEAGSHFVVLRHGNRFLSSLLPTAGRHNVENALGAIAVCASLGVSSDALERGLRTFAGVRRRQEKRGEFRGVLVLDDFAHHPTAVRETIAAVRARYPNRRLIAVFEPRSNTSRRSLHQDEYAKSFAGSALALLSTPVRHDKVPEGAQLDIAKLCRGIAANKVPAVAFPGPGEIVAFLAKESRPGDLVLAMSNGSFGGFVDKLIAALDLDPFGPR